MAATEAVRLDWRPVIERAAEIVRSYDTAVTLRQLFYRLIAAGLIPNSQQNYKRLSALTAEARREGTFPDLADAGRTIHRYSTWTSPADAIRDAAAYYRRDRTEGQDVALYIAVEKNTLVAQLESWFGDLGLPILALRGYSSESYERDIADDLEESANGRHVIVLYAGDFDPSGEDIQRNFEEQLTRRGVVDWSLERIALTDEQVRDYGLPESVGKDTDSRAAAFTERHGKLVQVEVEALAPEQLRELFQNAIDDFWQPFAYERVLRREKRERAQLLKLAK